MRNFIALYRFVHIFPAAHVSHHFSSTGHIHAGRPGHKTGESNKDETNSIYTWLAEASKTVLLIHTDAVNARR